MLAGFVSDGNYVALSGVDLEFENRGGSTLAQSSITGAVHVDLEPGQYRVSLGKSGYGSKHAEVTIAKGAPISFRLLSEQIYGFMWPKWATFGSQSEYCVHSSEEFRLDLWRYGWEKEFVRSVGWCGEHAPSAMTQILPDKDFTQTGIHWNRTGYTDKYQQHVIEAPEQSGLYYLHAPSRSGQFCSFLWIISPKQPPSVRIVVAFSESIGGGAGIMTWEGIQRKDAERF